MFRQMEPSGVFPNWLKIGALAALTLEVALFLRAAVTGQPLLFPTAIVVLTAVLVLITFTSGADARKSRFFLRRMALPAGVMAVGYGLWYIAARLNAPSGRSLPHWVRIGLANAPSLLICASFSVIACLLSLAIRQR